LYSEKIVPFAVQFFHSLGHFRIECNWVNFLFYTHRSIHVK
jgi:hypothetical protein